MYEITNHSKIQAKKLGVEIRPSTNKNKKLDVFKDDKKISSIGSLGMNDYGIYLKTKGKEYADERRRLYKLRHAKTSQVKNSPSFFSSNILW